MKAFLKRIVELIPYSIGSKLVFIPFKLRLGSGYTKSSNDILRFKNLKISEQEDFIVSRFSDIFEYAKTTFPFYTELYKKHGVIDLKIKCLKDIEKVPIISKSDIRDYITQFNGSLKLNTGGSTGEPFVFYVDKNAFAREWAHMHTIWKLKEYSPKDIKITFRGKDLGNRNIVFNTVHNEFIINTYKSISLFKDEFIQLLIKHDVKYIHGYPSAIYNFLKEFEEVANEDEKQMLKNSIIACFLGSEFPTPIITSYLSEKWNFDYISWYGHSEMCILAYDLLKNNKYIPFNTYGYTEVVDDKLIGTSFHNYDMPLIRYNTGDIVSANYYDNGLVKDFTITEGREGEFIIDNNGTKIALTALIFGRHHKAFEYVDFIQVKQDVISGQVIFYLVAKEKVKSIIIEKEMLDLQNINIDYAIEFIENPIKTKMGKVKLKIED